MLSRKTYIERGVVVAGLALSPWVPFAIGTQDPKTLALTSAISLVAFAIVGGIFSAVLHRMLAVRSIEWGGYEETAALLKKAGSELVTAQADKKLLDYANKEADNQDGRATGVYLFNRMAQLRQAQTFRRPTFPNPIPLARRIGWSLVLAVIAGLIAGWPWLSTQLPLTTLLVLAAASLPLFLTALLILGLGLGSADAWLYRVVGQKRKQRSTVKLRQREIKSAAGSWHTQSNTSNFPMFRVLGAAIVLIAATLYILREYEDEIFPSSNNDYAAVIAEDDAEETPERPAETGLAPKTSTNTTTQNNSVAPPRQGRPTATAAPRQQDVPLNQIWSRMRSNSVNVYAAGNALSAGGWDTAQLESEFTSYKRARLDEWYILHVREHPNDFGKVSFALDVQPQGFISNIKLLGAQIVDPTFTNGLIDRLDAIELRSPGADVVHITVSFDFQL